ncbi:MAG: retropepsin-like aspartic protease [Chloroflexota bacterium]
MAAPGESFSGEPIVALVDTGADATIIPYHHLSMLGLQVDGRTYLRAFGGARRAVDLYFVDIEIAGLRLPALEIVGGDMSDECIVGRDVLNRLYVVLDGPRLTIEIQA